MKLNSPSLLALFLLVAEAIGDNSVNDRKLTKAAKKDVTRAGKKDVARAGKKDIIKTSSILSAEPSSEPSTEPTNEPTNFCASVSREEAIESILVQITDGPILTKPATPQGQAYQWILNDDPLQIDPCTYPSIEQRYALATFYYSTGGDNWIVDTAWLSVAGECDWFGITCVDGKVTSISMGTYA
jgi:hypothetical protein